MTKLLEAHSLAIISKQNKPDGSMMSLTINNTFPTAPEAQFAHNTWYPTIREKTRSESAISINSNPNKIKRTQTPYLKNRTYSNWSINKLTKRSLASLRQSLESIGWSFGNMNNTLKEGSGTSRGSTTSNKTAPPLPKTPPPIGRRVTIADYGRVLKG